MSSGPSSMRLCHSACRHFLSPNRISSFALISTISRHPLSFPTRSFAQSTTANVQNAPNEEQSKSHSTTIQNTQSSLREQSIRQFPDADLPHPDNIERPTQRVIDVANAIHNLTMFEGLQLAKLLKEKYGIPSGVLTAAPMGGMPMGGAAAASAAPPEDVVVKKAPKAAPVQTMFAVRLDGFDAKDKIKVIKEIRSLTGLGLKESKELVEAAPKIIKKDLPKAEAEALQKKLQESGAKISLE